MSSVLSLVNEVTEEDVFSSTSSVNRGFVDDRGTVRALSLKSLQMESERKNMVIEEERGQEIGREDRKKDRDVTDSKLVKTEQVSDKKKSRLRRFSESLLTRNSDKMFSKNDKGGDFWPLPLDESQPIVDYHKANSHVDEETFDDDASGPMSPSKKVEFIIGRGGGMSESRQILDNLEGGETPKLFTEMEELQDGGEEGEQVWKETARWVKFEETVEDGGDRWSKPHVATLSLQSLFDLRTFLQTSSTFHLNMDTEDFPSLIDKVLDCLIQEGQLTDDVTVRSKVRRALLSNHEHQGEKRGRNKSVGGEEMKRRKSSSIFEKKTFMRKIPTGAEASNILIGEQKDLKKPIIAFVRLKHAITFDRLTEVPVPTRFVFILLGPRGRKQQYHEVGRSIATLMADEVFHEVAYKAKTPSEIFSGIDEFLQQVTVLPPGEWDKTIRIEPPQSLPQDQKKRLKEEPFDFTPRNEKPLHGAGPELKNTGRLFGGLMEDIKRKVPFYWSDYKDALNIQCVASFFFIYFAVLTPIVTFGGLLDDATHSYLGTMESLLGGCMAGTMFHLFSGQPLTIIGSTGPILVFEKIMNELCGAIGIEYINFRFWVGTWTGFACILLVAFDSSSLITYVTRFTEESFSALISLIFIFEAFKKLIKDANKHKIWRGWESEKVTQYDCSCQSPDISSLPFRNNLTIEEMITATRDSRDKHNKLNGEIFKLTNTTYTCVYKDNLTNVDLLNWQEDASKTDCIGFNCGVLEGESCQFSPDIFFMSVLLFLGTYFVAVTLKSLKTSSYFPSKVRSLISDFAVTIAIFVMVIVDFMLDFETTKLQVPSTFKPTRNDRGWFISPLGSNQWWTIPLAIIPAILATILIFMDQQITAVIVNRKENKLKKSCGYHLDLLVVSIMLIICSVMGLPWFVAATVLSITHVNSLRMESETAAPGEKPQFLGVREQRVTGFLVFLMIGVSVSLTPLLRKIPMPVLYGVFLYMGTSSLNGVQLFDRMMLFFIPQKYQPDYSYLRHVPLSRVHLFTFIQLLGLAVLWTIKSTKPVSIIFPIMVAALVGIRKLIDGRLFTEHELSWLDDVLPESSKTKKKKEKKKLINNEKNGGSSVCLKVESDNETPI